MTSNNIYIRCSGFLCAELANFPFFPFLFFLLLSSRLLILILSFYSSKICVSSAYYAIAHPINSLLWVALMVSSLFFSLCLIFSSIALVFLCYCPPFCFICSNNFVLLSFHVNRPFFSLRNVKLHVYRGHRPELPFA